MTILTLKRTELERLIGKVTPEIEEKITEMGTPVEEINEESISIEVFPNRPDLLSMQNFARSFNQFNSKRGLDNFKIYPPEKDYEIRVEKSVKKVRPYTVCAIAKDLKFDDEKIKEIIDIQEKLHATIGRKRKKVAIGIYPLEKIKMPIRFLAMEPENIRFIPLDMKKEISGKQILSMHPKGREFAYLLEGFEVFPIFIDSNNKILSMPPIINSEETGRITEQTKDIFIECSGSNLYFLKKCLSIITSAIYEMGGKIYSVRIIDSKEGTFLSPDMNFEEMEFKISDIEKTLGIKLNEKDVKKYLERMGIGYLTKNNKSYALIPPYRVDMIHWIDLAEEIAISYGYNNFQEEIPKISTIGQEDKFSSFKKTISNILIGLGFLEVSSYHLTTKENIKKIHYDFKDFIEVEESKTEKNVLRIDLLTNFMQIFFENSKAQYPQKIFEMGRVFSLNEEKESGVEEKENLTIAIIDDTITFTEIKQVLDYLFKMLDIKYEIRSTFNKNYIDGRVGKIIIQGKEIGHIGEIHPRVLKNWKIKLPIVAAEINLEEIYKALTS